MGRISLVAKRPCASAQADYFATQLRMRTLILTLICLSMNGAWATLRVEQIEVPVTVRNMFGEAIAQPVHVTIYSDDSNPVPAPVLVINHGRGVSAEDRSHQGLERLDVAARFFVRRGFIVAVPIRIGYGASGGDDLEDDGGMCERLFFSPGFEVAAKQVLTVLNAVRRRPDAAPDRAVLLGQSYGGAVMITVAAKNPPGVQLLINFAGGSGGDPDNRPGNPCSADELGRLFVKYGRTARVPMVWVYAKNDLFWGAAYPRAWFSSFLDAGGVAEFVQLPPHGTDGHSLFTRFHDVWQPCIVQYLDKHGFVPRQR